MFLIFSLIVFSSFHSAQTIIENPEKPTSQDDGRILEDRGLIIHRRQ